ncbi:ribbon-helix-helix protein, CopG family [Candidatus Bipolaricaulota bacterium]
MSDAERITIGVGIVDLGQIDRLVDKGLFATRSEFIRAAIRIYLEQYREEVVQAGFKKSFTIGTHVLNAHDLEDIAADGKAIDLHVVGSLTIAEDVSPELARKAVRSVSVYGSFRASEAVKAALADRMTK